MNYEQTLEYLFNSLPMFQRIGKAAYKADLNTTIKLDEYFNHPHQKFKSIHIAGTNGKGSVSHFLASVLQSAGYKTGLYTSPHLIDFRERIKINGVEISKEYVVEFVEKSKNIFDKLKPSFFEMSVALAFEYFKDNNVDIAVIETGMGGRLDSTNIINPLLSVITNIGLDHTEFLGDTLEKIAIEKSGIIKQNIPVIIGESNIYTKEIFHNKAKNLNCKIVFADYIYKSEYSTYSIDNKQIFHLKKETIQVYHNLKSDLLGKYQTKNICTVLAAIDELKNFGLNLSEASIYSGVENVVKNTRLMGRWQITNSNPLTICDTGHNEDGIKQIVEQIYLNNFEKLHIIFGVVNDKKIDKILDLMPKDAIYYFTKAEIPRALDEKTLFNFAREKNLNGNHFTTIYEAYNNAKLKASGNDLIFIGGSTFIVADFLKYCY